MAKKDVVAVDIGTNAVKLVEFELTSSGIGVVAVSVEPLPRQRALEEIGAEAIMGAVQRAWKNVRAHRADVALALPRLFVTSRRLTNLPPSATEEQLDGLVAMQAETELPFRVEDAIFDYHDVRRSSSSVSVELVAAKRQTVEAWMGYLKPINIGPKSILPSSLAIAVLAGKQLETAIAETPQAMTMVVDIGAGRTDVCLMSGSKLVFSRSFPVGGNNLTRLYEDAANPDFELAETRKLTHATLERQSEAAAPVDEWANRLVAELNRSIAGAQRELQSEGENPIGAIWLCGGGARVPGLATYIGTRLGIPTQLWRPLDALGVSEPALEALEAFQDTLAVALGVGVNTLTAPVALDLLPKEERQKLTQAEQRRRLVISVAAALALIVGLAVGGFAWTRVHQAKIVELDAQIRQLRVPEANAKKALVNELAVADLLTPRLTPLDILRELSIRFADRTQVAWTTFNLSRLDEPEKAKVTFTVEANSHEAISKMIGAMGQSGIFTSLKSGQITSTEKDRRPVFQAQITCNLSPESIQMFARARYLHQGTQPPGEGNRNVAERGERGSGSQQGGEGDTPTPADSGTDEMMPPPDTEPEDTSFEIRKMGKDEFGGSDDALPQQGEKALTVEKKAEKAAAAMKAKAELEFIGTKKDEKKPQDDAQLNGSQKAAPPEKRAADEKSSADIPNKR